MPHASLQERRGVSASGLLYRCGLDAADAWQAFNLLTDALASSSGAYRRGCLRAALVHAASQFAREQALFAMVMDGKLDPTATVPRTRGVREGTQVKIQTSLAQNRPRKEQGVASNSSQFCLLTNGKFVASA